MSLAPKAYTIAAANLHWLSAISMVGCIGCVLKAQESPKAEKGLWMYRHKSLGLLTGMIVMPRVAYRVGNRSLYKLQEIPGTLGIEHILAKVGHYSLYAFMTIMPASGIAMGYFGGKGLPFFGVTIPGISKTEENKVRTGNIAKQSFFVHKQVGVYGKYLIPIHAGAAISHSLRGHAIFSRINPFRSP